MEQGKKEQNSSRKNYKEKEPMKVKYISSPIMVNAKNADEFRLVVQELTGKSLERGGGIGSDGGGDGGNDGSDGDGGWPKYHDGVEYDSSINNIFMNIDNIDEYFLK